MQRDPKDDSTETIADSPRGRSTPKRDKESPSRLGRYVILSELGHGGMSTVYTAYDPELDRRVALKVVRGDRLSKAHRARLHREAQALARLSHPAVVTVFDVGDFEDDTFVAMELIDGMSLREWIKTPRTWREVVRVLVAAGRGLAAAHAAGILHRDVKPDNIVIATNGTVKLVDFGLARDLGDRTLESGEFTPDDLDLAAGSYDSSSQVSGSHPSGTHSSHHSGTSRRLENITQVGNIVGTPAYMPPEARSRRPEQDERSDQFSLCATIYEALFRQKPFKASKKGLLDRAELPTVAEDPTSDTRTLAAPPPKESDVPAWLQRAVGRGLAVEPSHRYPSVNDLLAAIDRDPARTWRRVGLAAGALVVVAATATFITSRMMPAQKAAGPTCATGDDRVAAIWNPDHLATMQKNAGAKAPWAAGAIEKFAARVEKYGTEWKTMYLEACEATRAQGIQSQEALDLRMACLDHRLDGLGALVTLMANPELDVLRRGGEVVDNLPPVRDCADIKALRLVVRRPQDPKITTQLDAIDRKLARLSALYAIGDALKAIDLADEVIEEAEPIGYAPPLAQAMYWKGLAAADRGSGEAAESMFDKAFSASISAGEDLMAADSAAHIAQEALWTARLPEFERWQRVAKALGNRIGSARIVAFVDQLGCMANHYTGKVQTRLRCLQELASRKGLGPPNEWLVTTLGIAASEAGAVAEAIRWLEQGVEVSRSANGPDHPRTLEMRAYLCNGLSELGDYKRAAGECADALARLKKSAPDDKLLIARLQVYQARAEIKLQHIDVARPLLEAAEAGGDEEVKLLARTELGDLTGRTGTKTDAVAQYRATLAETIKAFGEYNPRHPNIVAARHELGVALLKRGDAAAAVAELARADAEAEVNEVSPLELATLRFARSQAVLTANPAARDEARKYASEALAIYVSDAPDTERFRSERASIEAFVAKLDEVRH